ncbi:hypothetical protein [Streptomyces sp. MMBL 11-1]|uniref:hypothetical protein n=1 Tax=Streptomyces sp. MMBL 11-1 TaxID=3026420 RepID=UPI00235FB153|nr:hypothetical protein [Streptomyces sp. MMBL 11-1]
MQTFALTSGHTVNVARSGRRNMIEFVTRNPEGGVISTVRRTFAESVPLIKSLACRTR